MIIQSSTIPLISPHQSATARHERPDHNQPEQNSKSKNSTVFSPIIPFDQSVYERRIQAIGQSSTSAANSTATQADKNKNIQVQTALSQYREYADPEAQANQEQIHQLFGIDVIV